MTISEPNVKIPRLFDNGFRVYKTLFRSMGLYRRIYTTLMRLAFRWGLLGQPRLLLGLRGLSVQSLCSLEIQNGSLLLKGSMQLAGHCHPMIILKGKWHQTSWYENELPDDWRIETSESGWTNEELGLIWLKEIDIQQTHPSSCNWPIPPLDSGWTWQP
ncbi:hypothetical protein VTO42DRAFT_8733 [Malbranchea cinnamomea]